MSARADVAPREGAHSRVSTRQARSAASSAQAAGPQPVRSGQVRARFARPYARNGPGTQSRCINGAALTDMLSFCGSEWGALAPLLAATPQLWQIWLDDFNVRSARGESGCGQLASALQQLTQLTCIDIRPGSDWSMPA
jgi:hypothetical protein